MLSHWIDLGRRRFVGGASVLLTATKKCEYRASIQGMSLPGGSVGLFGNCCCHDTGGGPSGRGDRGCSGRSSGCTDGRRLAPPTRYRFPRTNPDAAAMTYAPTPAAVATTAPRPRLAMASTKEPTLCFVTAPTTDLRRGTVGS